MYTMYRIEELLMCESGKITVVNKTILVIIKHGIKILELINAQI